MLPRMELLRQKNGSQQYGDDSLEKIKTEANGTQFLPKVPREVGRSRVPTAHFQKIHSVESSDDVTEGDCADEIRAE